MKYFIILFLSSFAFISFAQDKLDPVHWEMEVQAQDNGSMALIITANIDEGWHLYSQHTDPAGPVPTSFSITSENIELIGEVKELTEPNIEMSDMFEMEVTDFSKLAKFEQAFNAKGNGEITAEISFMACDGLKCIPPRTIELQTTY